MKLIKRISIIASITLLAMAGVWYAPGKYAHDLAALLNKKDMLLSRKSPRIILIGGSNLTTINSRLIEVELNRSGEGGFSIANMGLWGGLSIGQYLDELKPYLKKSDKIVICQEYATMLSKDYFSYINTNKESKKFFFLMSPENHLLQNIKKQDYFELIEIIITLNQLKMKSYIYNLLNLDFNKMFKSGFQRYEKDYNEFGDRTLPFKIRRPLHSSGVIMEKPVIKNLSYLKKFKIYGEKKGINLFFIFPPFPEKEYIINKKQINSLYYLIKNDFEIKTLNSPVENIYPEEYFADTVNHLQPKWEKIRTGKMILQLKEIK